MSYEEDHRGRNGGATALLLIIFLGMVLYVMYTDEIQSTIDTTKTASQVGGAISGFKDLLPLSLANIPAEGQVICDLDLKIPTLLSNRAFFGTPKSSLITNEQGIKLAGIQDFLDNSEYLYINIETIDPPNWEWKNCYNAGTSTLAAITPLFNGQLASEKLSLLSIAEREKTISQDPNVASSQPTFTDASSLNLSIYGKNDSGLYLVDKYNRAVFKRIMFITDDLRYPVAETVRFTIENVKVDDYNIFITAKQPINEIRIGDPFSIKICGLRNDMTPKSGC